MALSYPQRAPARPLVLMVDDDEEARAMYAFALSAMGFDVMIDDAAHAQARAANVQPDIVMTELVLQDGDGWTLMRHLKNDPRTRDIPVVVVTGASAPSLRERAEREGCAAYCVKPCLPDIVALRLRAVLEGRPVHARVLRRR